MSNLLVFAEKLRKHISIPQMDDYSFLIEFARKATDIVAVTNISEEDFIKYFHLGLHPQGKETIPPHVLSSMLRYNIWS